MITRFRLPLIILVIAGIAAGGGTLLAKKLLGQGKPDPKVPVRAVAFEAPFIVNLADSGETMHYIKLALAVELEPMTHEDHAIFMAGGPEAGGGHGGGAAETGPMLVAKDPSLRDAVIRATAGFASAQLLTPAGKEELKKAILANMEDVTERYSHGAPHGEHKNAAEQPYHVKDVLFTEYAVQ